MCPENNEFGCMLTQFLTGSKLVTRNFGTRILRFNRETKVTKTVQKLSKKFTVRPKRGRSHHRPPPHCKYATDLGRLYAFLQGGNVKAGGHVRLPITICQYSSILVERALTRSTGLTLCLF